MRRSRVENCDIQKSIHLLTLQSHDPRVVERRGTSDRMKCVDIFLLRDSSNGKIRCIAHDRLNRIITTPIDFANEKQLLAQRDEIEKTLVDQADRMTATQLRDYGDLLRKALVGDVAADLIKAPFTETLTVAICTDDPELKRIPWEYMTWPNGKFSPRRERSVVRITQVAGAIETEPVKLVGRPMSVALIVANPRNLNSVPWQDLKEQLKVVFQAKVDATGAPDKLEIDIVQGASRVSVKEALKAKNYDVIHFVGHGEKTGLYFVNRLDGKSELVDVGTLVTLFSKPSCQLLILSACETGAINPAASIPTVAEQLVEQGIPAVIGSQMPMPDGAIATFSVALYDRLLRDGDIDAAIADARVDLNTELADAAEAGVEWGIPVLYRRPGRDRLFSVSVGQP